MTAPAAAQPAASGPAAAPRSVASGSVAAALSAASGPASGGRHTAETEILAPEFSGAFLNLLVPGAGHLYIGDPVRAGVYLGIGGLAAGTTYSLLMAGDTFVTPEEHWFASLWAIGAMLLIGCVSTADALSDVSGRYQAAEAALVPGPEAGAPVAQPRYRRRTGDDE